VNKKTEEVTYQHQMLGAAIIHPDHSEVIPLAPGAIPFCVPSLMGDASIPYRGQDIGVLFV
jgi:hypothetical protein